MYNEEIKRRFLDSVTNADVLKACKSVFNSLEQIERKYQKDLIQLSEFEVLNLADILELTNHRQVLNYRVGLMSYLDWCENNSVFDNIDHGILSVLEPDMDLSSSISKLYFRDENDLVYSMKKVIDFDDGFLAPVIFCLAWIGLKRSEILQIKDSDVSMNDRSISLCNGMVFRFNETVADVLQRYIICDVGHRDRKQGTYEVFKDISRDEFIKGFYVGGAKWFGTPLTNSKISTAITYLQDKYIDMGFLPRFRYMNVWNSGRYHTLWQYEQGGVDIFAKESISLVSDVFRDSAILLTSERGNLRYTLRTYRDYKKAFNL